MEAGYVLGVEACRSGRRMQEGEVCWRVWVMHDMVSHVGGRSVLESVGHA